MQIINEKEFSGVFGMGTAKVYVEEKVSKKQAKDMQAAIDVVYKEYESKNAGWKWVQK